MDQRDNQVRCLGICSWLYNLILKTIAAQSFKTVTLGQPQPDLARQGTTPGAVVPSIDAGTEKA
ncbi:hypothetical protein QQ045_026592 [Rhodiola kirilowii]